MTAIVDTHPKGRDYRLGSWVARCRKAIARPLKALILYPLNRPISCSQASKLGHEQHRARIRSTARQMRQELGLPPNPALGS